MTKNVLKVSLVAQKLWGYELTSQRDEAQNATKKYLDIH